MGSARSAQADGLSGKGKVFYDDGGTYHHGDVVRCACDFRAANHDVRGWVRRIGKLNKAVTSAVASVVLLLVDTAEKKIMLLRIPLMDRTSRRWCDE